MSNQIIKIVYAPNDKSSGHDDLIVEFPCFGKKFIGDSYWFIVSDETIKDENDIPVKIATYFLKDFNTLLNLGVKRSYFLFFHFGDESDFGVLVTRKNEENFEFQFICKLRDTPEYIFLDELLISDRNLFLTDLKETLDKLCSTSAINTIWTPQVMKIFILSMKNLA